MAQGSVTPSPRHAKGGGRGSGEGGALRAAMLVPGFTLLLPQIPPYLCLGEGGRPGLPSLPAGRLQGGVSCMWHQFSTLAKEPPSRLSAPRTRGAPSRIPSLGRCGGLLADPSPCSAEPQGWASAGADAPGQRRGAELGTRSAAGSTKPSFTGRRSRGRQGRGAAERHLAARPSAPRRLPRLPVGAGAKAASPGDLVSGNRRSLGAAAATSPCCCQPNTCSSARLSAC